jgi:hypothetical protein
VIPGSNLFKQASLLIRPTNIVWYRFASRALNASKQWITTYAAPENILASVQAVPRNKYIENGLEFQKNYVKIFAAANLIDLQRDNSGDRFIYGSAWYQIESNNPWFLQDGWVSTMAVQIPGIIPPPPPPDLPITGI